jgi:ComF family protein
VDPPLFRKVVTVFEYGGSVADALTKFKYASASEFAQPFANLLAKLSLNLSHPDVVIPVPLHAKRLVKRGFNQSALLGRPVARIQGARFSPGLVRRILDTAPQASCTRKARFENIKGAFAVTNPEKVRGRRILIVDDVITTGATIREISKVLIRAKAKSVEVIAVARAS